MTPDVEGLLRGAPRASAPDDLRIRVLAAYERSASREGRPAWTGRWGVAVASAAVAASLVLTAGAFVGEQASPAASVAWEQVHPMPTAVAKVRVVDDPNLALFGAGSPVFAVADPMEGP